MVAIRTSYCQGTASRTELQLDAVTSVYYTPERAWQRVSRYRQTGRHHGLTESWSSMSVSEILRVFGLAALPISELRGAIPLAIGQFHFTWYYAFLVAFLGNLVPVFAILLLFDPAVRLISKVPIGKRFLDWLFEKVRKRGQKVDRYETIGLALFVAIPLPVTGAWTGSILAALRGYRLRYAFPSIIIGVIIAGCVVTAAWVLGWNIFWLATS
jgi:uncharacterized membrane protein